MALIFESYYREHNVFEFAFSMLLPLHERLVFSAGAYIQLGN